MDQLTTAMVEERNVQSAMGFYADDAVIVTPDAGEVRGREGIADYWRHLIDAFPDSHYEPISKHEAGNAAIDEGWLEGTNTAPLSLPTGETVPATGRPIKVRSCDVATVENGKIKEHHLYFDQMEFLGQLGLGPES
ncbi:ester cyclase [Micromonospora deserti]|nr:nuclear transport factor 2 family protein [Micromonospora deserti]